MKKAPHTLALAAVAALALVGCSYSAGDAAVAEGTKVTEAHVQAAAEAAAPLVNQDVSAVAPAVVLAEVQGTVAERVAAAKGVTLSDAVRAPIIAANPLLAQLAADPRTTAVAKSLADLSIVTDRVGVETFATECAKAQIVVNPRYGTWTPARCTFNQDLGGLALPAPSPAAKS